MKNHQIKNALTLLKFLLNWLRIQYQLKKAGIVPIVGQGQLTSHFSGITVPMKNSANIDRKRK